MRQRYGGYVHGLFIILNLVNNIFGCGSMILAGSQLVTGMTGMNVIAACILIPAGVVLYTAVGGLKATFLTDFLHTTIALILLIYFSLAVLTNEHVGGPSGLYEKVKAANWYVEGNYKGSLLSFKSEPGMYRQILLVCISCLLSAAILFGLVLKFGNLALVLMDTAFWQKSFAAEVSATVPGYDLASVVIIAIPWCTGTVIGLTARAIEKTPVWYTYPRQLTTLEINSGLVMPYVLRSLLGTGATAGLLVLIFMAITSTISSSMIAVSSIISMDFYRTYFNPRASDRKTLRVSHIGVVFHGCFMAGFAIMLVYAGATNYWATYFRPIVACPGILPMVLALSWNRQTKAAAIISPILGLCSGMAVWLSLSWKWSGVITIESTQDQVPGLYGAITSFFSPALYSVIISLLWPARFDWRVFLQIGLIEDKTTSPPSGMLSSIAVHGTTDVVTQTESSDHEKKQPRLETEPSSKLSDPPILESSEKNLDHVVHPFGSDTIRVIKRWLKIAVAFFVVNVLCTIILWPLPLYRNWIFTKSFFDGWVVMAMIWQWFALCTVVIFPVYDGRHAIAKAVRGMVKDSGWLARSR
jgi:urea-proton symporter